MKSENWNKVLDHPPTLNRVVIVFRHARKKYIIGRYQITYDESGVDWGMWVTEYNNCHVIDPEDHWMEFEPFSHQRTYK